MKECGSCKKLLLGADQRKFCSKSCAVTFNNFTRAKKSLPLCKVCGNQNKSHRSIFCSKVCFQLSFITSSPEEKSNCLFCDKQILKNRKYCSVKCIAKGKEKEKLIQWRSGEDVGFSNFSLRRILREEDGCECSKCRNTHWNGLPIALEVEHRDGNSSNNLRNNVCLLCPNCHAQTPTYKYKNVGNGRAFRRERYKSGKSY